MGPPPEGGGRRGAAVLVCHHTNKASMGPPPEGGGRDRHGAVQVALRYPLQWGHPPKEAEGYGWRTVSTRVVMLQWGRPPNEAEGASR